MVLETERLILRPWEEKDAESLVNALNDLETIKWLGGFYKYPYTMDMALDFIHRFGKSEYEWAIILKDTNEVIGGTSISSVSRDGAFRLKFANEGVTYINRKYSGHGYGFEAFQRKLEYVFYDLNVVLYTSAFDDGNIASYCLQAKCGAKVTGLELNQIPNFSDGATRNILRTTITKEDFELAMQHLASDSKRR